MNTKEIDQFVRGDKASRGIFQGVFSVDTLPDKPRLLVCNTDPSSKPGSHWIVIFTDSKGRGEYFDSFGRKPTALFEDYMNKNCSPLDFQHEAITEHRQQLLRLLLLFLLHVQM
jgi:hypothetical protein